MSSLVRDFGVPLRLLGTGNVVAQSLAVSLDKPLEWAAGFFFGKVELWNIIVDMLGFGS